MALNIFDWMKLVIEDVNCAKKNGSIRVNVPIMYFIAVLAWVVFFSLAFRFDMFMLLILPMCIVWMVAATIVEYLFFWLLLKRKKNDIKNP